MEIKLIIFLPAIIATSLMIIYAFIMIIKGIVDIYKENKRTKGE